ncbi:hypothetical protein [Pelagerythrobacter sp.]|uniref:hypothetical protein n=1 Tax=Pelagerythrobacter sp. TaxID=2800702 RepID=UPI0035AE8FFF
MAEWLRTENPDAEGLMVRTGRVDLDADGVEEMLIYLGGPGMCGSGGCNLIVLKDDGERLSRLGELSVAQLPVGALDSATNGLRDLAVTTYGGGAPERIMKVPFDGAAYASNPTVPPAAPSDTLGTPVIGEGELQPLD